MSRTRQDQGRANQVRAYRVLRELTQAGLAAQAGVSRQTINALEAGDYAPSVYLALRLAAVLDTTVERLFAGPQAAGASRHGTHLVEQEQS